MMQTLNFARSGRFEIKYQCFGAMPGHGRTDLFRGPGHINRIKVLGETDRQSLGGSRVILIDNYAQ